MPLPAHMVDDLDSPIADLANAKIGDPGRRMLFAGLFLRHFVGRTSDEADAPRIPWAHLDIAGVGMNKGGAVRLHRQGSDRRRRCGSLIRFIAGEAITMSEQTFDLVVLGGGSGGYAAALRAANSARPSP